MFSPQLILYLCLGEIQMMFLPDLYLPYFSKLAELPSLALFLEGVVYQKIDQHLSSFPN
jgi:hypothetical protein